MPILETFTLADTSRQKAVSRENGFRGKILEAIDLQIAAVSAAINGQPFKRTVQRYINNGETGNREQTAVEMRFRPWWWKDQAGTVFLELRYANSVLVLGKDQSAIEVGTKDKLVPTIETVVEAVKAGELDAAMTAALASRKKPGKKA